MNDNQNLRNELTKKLAIGLNMEYDDIVPNKAQLTFENKVLMLAMEANPQLLSDILVRIEEHGKNECIAYQKTGTVEQILKFIDYTTARTIAVNYYNELMKTKSEEDSLTQSAPIR